MPLLSALKTIGEHNEQFRGEGGLVSTLMKPYRMLTRSHPSNEKRAKALGTTQAEVDEFHAVLHGAQDAGVVQQEAVWDEPDVMIAPVVEEVAPKQSWGERLEQQVPVSQEQTMERV